MPFMLIVVALFQCSSASRKFLNFKSTYRRILELVFQCSSASRKFLNSDTPTPTVASGKFQCSSASRKFLNYFRDWLFSRWSRSFSALQRAENSSIAVILSSFSQFVKVSVLFSEPKIPQFVCGVVTFSQNFGFQCSSASRKFLN